MAGNEDPDEMREPGNEESSRSGTTVFFVAALVIVIFAVVLIGGAAASRPAPTMCTTSCALFARFECPGDRFIGLCAGVWLCSSPTHVCGTDPP